VVAGPVGEGADALAGAQVGELPAEGEDGRLDVDGRDGVAGHEHQRHLLPLAAAQGGGGAGGPGAGVGAGAGAGLGAVSPIARLPHGAGEGRTEREGVARAMGGILAQATKDQLLERGGHRGQSRGAGGPEREVGVLDLPPLAGEGEAQGGELEQHHPQAIDIGAEVAVLAADLLGGHVLGRAGATVSEGLALGGPGHWQGQAEVHQLRPQVLAVADQEDVLGLEVAVKNPLHVQGGRAREQGRPHRPHHRQRRRLRPVGDLVAQGAPL